MAVQADEPQQPSGPASVSSDPEFAIEVIEGEEFDFGIMDEGEERSHDFVFRNNTDKSVRLEVQETTCKCTVGELEREIIPPRGEVNVTLTWKPVIFEREFRQSAIIATDCADRRKITLAVSGRVSQSLTATPRDIAFSDVSYRDGRKSALVIHALKDADFRITGHSWSDPDTEKFFEFVIESCNRLS